MAPMLVPVPPVNLVSHDPAPWWRRARVRYRLFRVCGRGPLGAALALLPGSKWLLRTGAVLLGLWLA